MSAADSETSNELQVNVDEATGKGELVYTSYNSSMHVYPYHDPMKMTTHINTLIAAIETGLNPAVVVMELGNDGVLRVYDAAGKANTPANLFCRDTVIPLLYGHGHLLDIGACELVLTPPKKKGGQCNAQAAFQIYSAIEMFKGKVRFAPTNVLQARLAASERFLSSVHPQILSKKRSLRGEKPTPTPGLQICHNNARLLIEAISEKYRYKPIDDDSPKKPVIETAHPHSDVVTAFQYGCLFADQGETFGCPLDSVARPMSVPESENTHNSSPE